MARAVPVALLVVCLLVGSASGFAAPPPSNSSDQLDDDGRTADLEMLGLDSPSRSDVSTQGVDVSTAVAIQHDAARSAIDRRAFEISFGGAEDDQERRELVFQAATDVEIGISGLRADNRALRSDYANGTVGPGAYVRGRAESNARADQLRTDLELIQRYADRVPQLTMRSRLESLRVALTGADGPVSDRLEATIVGEEPTTSVYVRASSDGRVLSVITGEQYVREAYRSDVWTPDTTTGVAFDEAVARTNELYPVAFNSSRNIGRGVGEHGAGTYQISMEVREGDIVTYLDGDTRNVFFETQRFGLAAIESGPAVEASDNGTRLVVNRSYDGGPLRIAAFDNTTRTPVDVTTVVDGSPYRTGPDGAVWVLDPAGSTEVVAVGEAGNVSVDVLPISPTLVDVQPVE